MKKEFSVGVIGLGHWGPNLLRNFNELGALSAFCDLNTELCSKFSELYPNADKHEDPEQFFKSDKFDAVVIATPAASHGSLVRKALQSGKHVFVEKPLCLDVEEAHDLKKHADDSELILMVGHLLLYHPAFIALKNHVSEGRLGDLRYIYSNRLSLGKIRREENALWSFAPHDISMILNLTSSMPTIVSTNGGNYLNPSISDITLSHLTFDKGIQAHIFVSWLHPYKDHKLVVIGSNGMAVFQDNVAGADKLLFYPHIIEWKGDLPNINRAEAEPIPYADSEPLAEECAHFLYCIINNKIPRSNATEGIQVLSVLDACQQSLRNGNPVDINKSKF